MPGNKMWRAHQIAWFSKILGFFSFTIKWLSHLIVAMRLIDFLPFNVHVVHRSM